MPAFVTEPPAPPAPVRRRTLGHYAAAIRPFSVRGNEAWRADFALALLEDAREHAWRVFVATGVEPAIQLGNEIVFAAKL